MLWNLKSFIRWLNDCSSCNYSFYSKASCLGQCPSHSYQVHEKSFQCPLFGSQFWDIHFCSLLPLPHWQSPLEHLMHQMYSCLDIPPHQMICHGILSFIYSKDKNVSDSEVFFFFFFPVHKIYFLFCLSLILYFVYFSWMLETNKYPTLFLNKYPTLLFEKGSVTGWIGHYLLALGWLGPNLVCVSM